MKVVVKDGLVFATHDNEQVIEHLYEGCEVYILDTNEMIEAGSPDPRVVMSDDERTRLGEATSRKAAIAELAELDRVLPRSTEDLISILGKWDDPALAFQKTRKARKDELRAIIKGGA